jgi:pyrimidine operon attenuation protein/uracil phosphoribosyltransferase
MTAQDVNRAIRRIAHEIIERNQGLVGVNLIGLQTGGVPLAVQLSQVLTEVAGEDPPPVAPDDELPAYSDEDIVPVGSLDVAMYRDDIGLRPVLPEAVTDIPFSLDGQVVVLVDDVLFTGRTIRAALNALNDFGRPRAVQLAVMIDRGHRELPIRPDFVGKNLPTRRDEAVNVHADGVDLGEVVK